MYTNINAKKTTKKTGNLPIEFSIFNQAS